MSPDPATLPGRWLWQRARSAAWTFSSTDAYAQTAQARRHYRERNDGRQAGDPAKAVAVVLQAVDAENPPLHLPLGPAAHRTAARKLDAFRADIAAWRDVSIATDFEVPATKGLR